MMYREHCRLYKWRHLLAAAKENYICSSNLSQDQYLKFPHL